MHRASSMRSFRGAICAERRTAQRAYDTNETVTIGKHAMLDATKTILVFDVGGSHVSAAECALPDLSLGRVAIGSVAGVDSAEVFLRLLFSLWAEAGAHALDGVSLAFPGPFDYTRGVSQMEHKHPFLKGVDLRSPLAKHFDVAADDVTFVNDAAAYLMGEVGAGAARNVAHVVGLTLGTGIGSAFAVNEVVVSEGRGVPPGGEIWNLPYEGGIVEDAISTRAIQQNYRKLTGRTESVSHLATLAASDRAAEAVFVQFGSALGTMVRTLLAEFAPEAVVLGGGISRSSHLFLPAARAALSGMTVELRVAQLQDNAPLAGAGAAWQAWHQTHPVA